jgi:hypothetical protein
MLLLDLDQDIFDKIIANLIHGDYGYCSTTDFAQYRLVCSK